MSIKRIGWIGVDFDHTLAEYHPSQADDGFALGVPIPAMVERVKRWLNEGKDVRILTARATNEALYAVPYDSARALQRQHEIIKDIERIKKWCAQYIGRELPVTGAKDFNMIALYDDRAVQVIANKGELATEHTWGCIEGASCDWLKLHD
jgi:hypothetical protein